MSPRSTAQFEEIRQQSRKKIVNTALELFAKQGFHATSISQIAKQAGVSKGLMYNYFDTKEELLMAIVVDAMEEGQGFFAQIMEAKPGKERLRLMLEMTFHYVVENYEHQKLLASLALQMDQFPEIGELIRQKYTNYIPMLAEELRIAGHPQPEKHAWMLSAIMDGIGLQYVVLGIATPLDRMKQDLIDEYCS